jgi:uncharacterized protein YsxB (DUF464 family)
MIKIKFFERKHRYAISTTGHAEYAPKGWDIVCAGVSALMQSYGNYVTDHENARSWKVLEARLEEGDSNVEVIDADDSIKELFYMTMEGLEDIQKAYPGNITIEYKS